MESWKERDAEVKKRTGCREERKAERIQGEEGKSRK